MGAKCNKVVFTKKEAEAALKKNKKGRQYRREKRFYFCEDCNGWHLTSIEYWEKTDFELLEPARWRKLLKWAE